MKIMITKEHYLYFLLVPFTLNYPRGGGGGGGGSGSGSGGGGGGCK